MKRTLKAYALPLLIASLFFITSCKKDESPKTDLAAAKKEWVTGSWKQKDIQLGVSTSVTVPGVGKIRLNEGMSMLDDPTINALLTAAAGANPFLFTRNNTYNFNGDGNYKVDGIVDFGGGAKVLAGGSGAWDTEVYSSVLALFPEKDQRDPHWINNITATRLNLAISVKLPGLGDVPMKLLLEKQ
ncbi:hypothetical protein [Agriterribacter sp.]|uniref:hypothetical protein n=1 Tax=Agriterribacter sp. TaxID=2821509 RepID=UPI002C0F66B5|nr:hypothetical protein [Agriterribacter sp.]HRO45473.1 hypothetical protein [Agriterribacter sp.]HRQ18890.1 hypothetical protein [Agriterribacter sp.]